MGLNWWQLSQVLKEWQQASIVSEKLLAETRKLYFPIAGPTNLIFVGAPDRIGRAWLFPVGLPDAMNHVFGDARLRVYTVGTKNEGLRLAGELPPVTHVVHLGESHEVSEIFN